MKPTRIACLLAAPMLLAAPRGDAHPAAVQRPGTICPDPAHPCGGFQAHDLTFVPPRDGIPRDEFRSEPFYAVILRSGARCSIPERERLAVQALFPRRKVFSHRFFCDEIVENNITYTNVDENLAFLAVYAGKTREEAAAFLRSVNAMRRFPGANLRRMQAVLVYD
ncbi:MAG TPA: hypothetical protein VF092_15875 [Longimicrobium sp.]